MIKLIVLVTALLTAESTRLEYYRSFADVAACEAEIPLATERFYEWLAQEHGVPPELVTIQMTCEPSNEPPDWLDMVKEILAGMTAQGGIGHVDH